MSNLPSCTLPMCFIICPLYCIELFFKMSIIAHIMSLNIPLASFCKRNRNTAETSLPPRRSLFFLPKSFPKATLAKCRCAFHARFYTFPLCVNPCNLFSSVSSEYLHKYNVGGDASFCCHWKGKGDQLSPFLPPRWCASCPGAVPLVPPDERPLIVLFCSFFHIFSSNLIFRKVCGWEVHFQNFACMSEILHSCLINSLAGNRILSPKSCF